MSHNTFGHLFRVTTWGESHGPALGCVVDGCPPLIPLTEDDIQGFMDKQGSRYRLNFGEAIDPKSLPASEAEATEILRRTCEDLAWR